MRKLAATALPIDVVKVPPSAQGESSLMIFPFINKWNYPLTMKDVQPQTILVIT